MGTTRCDCRQLSFIALRSYAQRHGVASVDELIRLTGCCTGCGTCRPHLEEFLRTGAVRYGDGVFRLSPGDPPASGGAERAPTPEAGQQRSTEPPAALG
jgi:bacterioferritin-associated ferredoxin